MNKTIIILAILVVVTTCHALPQRLPGTPARDDLDRKPDYYGHGTFPNRDDLDRKPDYYGHGTFPNRDDFIELEWPGPPAVGANISSLILLLLLLIMSAPACLQHSRNLVH